MRIYLICIVFFILCVLAAFGAGVKYSDDACRNEADLQAEENHKREAASIEAASTEMRIFYEKQIANLKKRKPLPDTCILSVDFSMRHNQDAGLPEGTTARPVTVEELAGVMRDNYQACIQNAIWLKECNRICQ